MFKNDLSDKFHLTRFLEAQHGTFDVALRELQSGEKRSHWMWFIFPQLTGLGYSPTAQLYAIKDLEEAKAYARHPVLGTRLRQCTAAVNNLQNRTAFEIFGSPDTMKFRSSMTLFAAAADDPADFTLALEKYFLGKKDSMTLQLLKL
ncbi:MAG: DUF1810 domain-containing protein [Bacteroidota bacterium]